MPALATKQDKSTSRRPFRLLPLAAVALMLCLLAAACLSPLWKGDGGRTQLLLAMTPGSAMPAMVLADYGGGRSALILFPGNKGDAQALGASLKARGTEAIDALFVPAYSPCHRGTAEWVASWPVRQAYLTDKSRTSSDFSPLLDAAAEGRITLSRLQPQEDADSHATVWTVCHNGWTWSYHHWSGGSARVTIQAPADPAEYRIDSYATGECVVSRMEADGSACILLTSPRCNRLQQHVLTLYNRKTSVHDSPTDR